MLQKEFTVDYLQKKVKKNEGELPQYYVKEDHEPIISPWLFDYVQKRLKERGDVPGRYSGVTVLSSKLECGVCGSLYTPRPWHSTSYNNLVWQCRNKTKKGQKCPTLNVYDKGYAKAMIDFVVNKYKGQYTVVQVGTGDSPLTIPFYEKCGFVYSHSLPNFFIDNYDHPIFENGIQLVDMVYLKRPL